MAGKVADSKIQAVVTPEQRRQLQEWGQAHGYKSMAASLSALVARGMVDHEPPPPVNGAPGPNPDQLHADAMRTLSTAHTVLGLLLRVMADHNATKEDKRAAVDYLRSACEAIEDTL